MENMQNLKVREEIYEQFLAFKSKVKPNLSNDDFIQFLMNRFENCCSKVNCNGSYANGIKETSEVNSNKVKEESPNDSATMQYSVEKHTNSNSSSSSTTMNQENTPSHIAVNRFVCPECKYMSSSQQEIENHFDECHDLSGTFPCTCNQCFNSMSHFLAHYIICPIAATDLLQNSFNEEQQFEESESIQDEEKEPSEAVFESRSPLTHSTEQTPIQNDDSDDLPLDYANPLNLVKNESKETPITDYSINAMNMDYSSHSEKACLPISIHTSSPNSQDQPKRTGKVYECEHCEKNFKSKGLLDQHKHLHFPPRHECEYCGRRFRWPPQFYTHKQQCSKRKLALNDSQDSNNGKKTNFNYSTISTSFNHNESRIQQSPKVFSHQIPDQCLCGFKTTIITDMYEHKRTCIASARAMILQKIIDYKSMQNPTLISNIQTVNGGGITSPSVHSVIPNFIPNSTSAPSLPSFPVLSNSDNVGLTQTLPVGAVAPTPTNTLQDEKPFECDFCESRFMTKISLKQHLDGKHSDQAKYCCEKCGKGYFWNASYNYHKKKCMMKPLTAAANLSN